MTVNHVLRATTTILFALVVSVIPAAAQVGHSPFQATPVTVDESGWQVSEVTPLEIAGTAIALSPDGTTIAGLGAEGALCFWTVDGLDQACSQWDGERDLDIDPDSIAWAPDSSAVAFSVLAYRFFIDGDIYLAEREGTTIQAITEDGIERHGIQSDDGIAVPVDVMPAWTPDSASIVFTRTVWDDRDELSTEILRVPRAGGDPETLLSLPGLPAAIFLPMRVLSDGSIVYTVGFNDQDEPTNGLWILSPQGDATQLVPGTRDSDFPIPVINDVREIGGDIVIIGHSLLIATELTPGAPLAFVWSSDTGEATPISSVTDRTGLRVYPGAISPDGGTLLSFERPPAEMPLVALQGPESSTTPLPETGTDFGPGRPIYITATWSNANLVLVAPYLTAGAYLLTVEPA